MKMTRQIVKVCSSGFSLYGAPSATPHRLKPGLGAKYCAFTLIEMMIALAVFAVVLAAINGVFWGALRLRKKTVESIDAALPKERALAIMRNDLANIVPPSGKFFTTFTTTGTTTNANGVAMTTMPGQNSPEFTVSNG